MATIAGYNPSVSLLPNGGGTIQAMSGGGAPPGFNPSISLLPPAGGDINSYKGGFFDQDIQIIGGDGPAGRAASSPAAVPSGTPPVAEAPRAPRKKPAVASNAGPAQPQPTGVPPPANGAAQPPVGGPEAPKPEEPKAENAKPEAGTENATTEDAKVKKIVIFGKSLDLEDPRKMNSDVLTSTQVEALKLFGLDGDRVSQKEKRDIIIALFDGKCNTDKPLIFLQNCEPIRRIVQSLALNLLSTLQKTKGPGLNGVEKEPDVSFQELNDGSLKVCINFAPNQLSILSNFVPKSVINAAKKGKNANKPPVPSAAPEGAKPPAAPKPPGEPTAAEEPEGEGNNGNNNGSNNGSNNGTNSEANSEENNNEDNNNEAAAREAAAEENRAAEGRRPPAVPSGLPADIPAGKAPAGGPPGGEGLPTEDENNAAAAGPPPAEAQRNFYQVLGTDRYQIPVEAEYRRLVKGAHPNRGGTHQQAQEINRAWEILSTPGLKEIYDAALQRGETHARALEIVEQEEQRLAGERRNENEAEALRQEEEERRAAERRAAPAEGNNGEGEEEDGEPEGEEEGEGESIAPAPTTRNNNATRNKAARNKATENMPSVSGLFGENSNNNFVNSAAKNNNAKKAAEPAALKNNSANAPAKKYSATNVKIFSQKLSQLQRNLEALQRGKRTPDRAKRINSIKANIQSIKALTGRNSTTIKNDLTKIRNKYANVNTQKRLKLNGGKKRFVRRTIKKNKLKSKSQTFRKNKK